MVGYDFETHFDVVIGLSALGEDMTSVGPLSPHLFMLVYYGEIEASRNWISKTTSWFEHGGPVFPPFSLIHVE